MLSDLFTSLAPDRAGQVLDVMIEDASDKLSKRVVNVLTLWNVPCHWASVDIPRSPNLDQVPLDVKMAIYMLVMEYEYWNSMTMFYYKSREQSKAFPMDPREEQRLKFVAEAAIKQLEQTKEKLLMTCDVVEIMKTSRPPKSDLFA